MRRALYPAEKKTENRLTNQADSSPFCLQDSRKMPYSLKGVSLTYTL